MCVCVYTYIYIYIYIYIHAHIVTPMCTCVLPPTGYQGGHHRLRTDGRSQRLHPHAAAGGDETHVRLDRQGGIVVLIYTYRCR